VLVITPFDIVRYSQCPALAHFSIGIPFNQTPEIAIISRTIKKAYSYQISKGFSPTWAQIKLWAEGYLTEDYKEAKNVLSRLSSWYSQYLDNFMDSGVPNLPVIFRLDNIITYYDMIPIVTTGRKLRIFDIRPGDSTYTPASISIDLLAQTRSWGLWRASEAMPEEYVRLVVTPSTIRPVIMTVLPHVVQGKIEPIVRHILRGFRDEIWYPSMTEQCINCMYREKCGV
jgi:hypothetical protein